MWELPGRRLVSDRGHDSEHALGAMIEVAHQQVLPLLVGARLARTG
jgi:hypothetical protein